MTPQNSEFGIRNSEWRRSIPHSAFRLPAPDASLCEAKRSKASGAQAGLPAALPSNDQGAAQAGIPHSVAGAGIGIGVMFLLTMLMPATAFGCPGCKEALFDPGQLSQKLSMAKGYALSIGLLLAVPVALVGGLTVLIVRSARRK